MFEWNLYLGIILVLGALFFASAIYALFWAVRNKQFQDFDRGARTIFSEDEPEGTHTDYFPGEKAKARRKLEAARKP